MDSWLSLLYEAKHGGMKGWVALSQPLRSWVALSWLLNLSEQFCSHVEKGDNRLEL